MTGTVSSLFRQRVAEQPEALALVVPGAAPRTYADLARDAGHVASALVARGVGRGQLVGVCAERGADAVVALLAVVLAGAHYVPVSPIEPPARLRRLLDRAAPHTVVRTGAEPTGPHRPTVALADLLARALPGPPADRTDPGDPVYLLHTSGTTGEPRGVVCTHAAVVNLVAAARSLGLSPRDRVLHLAPLGFDATTFELLVPLCLGATVVVSPAAGTDLLGLRDLLAETEVSVAWLTAGLCHELSGLGLALPESLRLLLAGGDVLRPAALRRLSAIAPWLTLVNGYGPTECTTFSAWHRVRPDDLATAAVPIGLPLPGVRTHVLGRDGRVVAPGEVGELHVSGAGLATGYHGDAAATADRFVPDPFGPPGTRTYRTGDLASVNPDGTLAFHGRVDRQVKIRGFRVEPGEVETALAAHPAVRQAAVVAVRDDLEAVALTGYAVLDTSAADPDRIRGWLAERLPAHLVPARVVAVARLPLRPNGKVDLDALPRPPLAPPPAAGPPATATHRLVAETWQEVLGVDAVTAEDNFFELGGDSLRMMRVVAALRVRTGLPLSFPDLLSLDTVAEVAEHLEQLSAPRGAPNQEAHDGLRSFSGPGPAAKGRD